MNTHEYEGAFHINHYGLDSGFVMALCFLHLKSPKGVGSVIEIPNHARRHFGGRWLGGIAGSFTRLKVVTCWFMTH
jgi:hypothetical protein